MAADISTELATIQAAGNSINEQAVFDAIASALNKINQESGGGNALVGQATFSNIT